MKNILTPFIIVILVISFNLPVNLHAEDAVGKPVIKVTVRDNNVTLTIKKTENAKGYKIYLKTYNEDKFNMIEDLEKDGSVKRKYTIKNLLPGNYKVKVQAYNEKTVSAFSKTKGFTVKNNQSRKIIIDTDTGADDASAIILAAMSKQVEILGVTTLVGNVDLTQSTKNALMALEIAGCEAPVYEGASERYNGKKIFAFSVFGEDGMGDAGLINPQGKAQDQDAVSFILDSVKNNPGEIELVVLGPATNIAKAIKEDPETMKNVKMIWSMGTAGLGPGNASPVAEFNVYGDAEAYKIMLDSGIPVTVIGLDCCGEEAMWTGAEFTDLKETGKIGEFVSLSFEKIRQFYASNGSNDATMNCDSVAMMCMLYPDFIKSSIKAHGSCITKKGETYAQVIFYKEGFTYDVVKNDFDYNVTLVTNVDKAGYFDRYKNTIN